MAIALCSYFSSHLDRPETDPDTENGWGEWVEQKTNDALELIAKTVARRLEEAQQQIARRDSAADDEAVLGDHNLIPSLQAEFEQLQQKIVAQEAKDNYVGRWLSAALDDPSVCDEMKADIRLWMASDAVALAAHDAKVAAEAEAKAEALEEGSEKCHEMYLYTGYDCANALGNRRIPGQGQRKEAVKDWHEKPPATVRSVADAMRDAERQRSELPHVIQVYARDWDNVILADEVLRFRAFPSCDLT